MRKEFGALSASILESESEIQRLEMKLKYCLEDKDLPSLLSTIKTFKNGTWAQDVQKLKTDECQAIQRTLGEMNRSSKECEGLQKRLKGEVLQGIAKSI